MEINGDKLGRELLRIKGEIDRKSAKRLELQGERKSLMNQLKELGAGSLKEAEKIIQQTEQELKGLKESIEEQIEEIEEIMKEGE